MLDREGSLMTRGKGRLSKTIGETRKDIKGTDLSTNMICWSIMHYLM